jgi:SAM-dependent methyltransferase
VKGNILRMKPFLNRALRKIVALSYNSNALAGIKPIVKSILLEGTVPLSLVMKNKSFGVFIDTMGNKFYLVEGLRDAVKPGWQWVLKPRRNRIPGDAHLAASAKKAGQAVSNMLAFLELFDFKIHGKAALEIGCYDGSKTFKLLASGSGNVTGSDMPEYYLFDHDKNTADESALDNVRAYLYNLRMSVAKASFARDFLSGEMEKIAFVEDDIGTSTLPSAHFDLVCSWEVLEHVREPQGFFHQLYRVLKPGGITFHEYNPFFSFNGGHSQCTLDFLWGHVLLNTDDFERYIREMRKYEYPAAFHTFRNSLNRMTLSDLKRYSRESGLQLIALIPWHEKPHLELLTPQTLSIAQKLYPSLTIEDLISPFVWIVLKKPIAYE